MRAGRFSGQAGCVGICRIDFEGSREVLLQAEGNSRVHTEKDEAHSPRP